MIKAIILDFDGVILESVDVKTDAYRKLFLRYTDNIEPIINYHLKNNGLSRYVKFKYIWETFLGRRYDDKARDELAAVFSEMVMEGVLKSPFVPGAFEFLEKFYKRVSLYVSSLVPIEELTDIIAKRNITKYFKGIYGFPPVTKYEAISSVMAREGLSEKEIVFIGDSFEDLKAARSAGIFFIARRNKEDFSSCAVPVFDDLTGVEGCIRGNFEILG